MSDRQTPEYLQLTTDDDAASVRDRLSFFRGRAVVLIWPETGTTLARKLDLVLVQREAMRKAIRLALVTHDAQVIRNAHDLNISTFETLRDSQRTKWKRGRSRVFATRLKRPGSAVDPDELMEYASRLRDDEDTPLQRRLRFVTRLVVLIGLLIAILVTAIVVIPGAQITVSPAERLARVDTVLIADPNAEQAFIDVENGVIPALILRAEVEERGTIPTSGEQEISSTPAIGSVVFINRTSSPVEILADSLVSTSGGTPIVFRVLDSITLPGGDGQQVEASIEAIPESSGAIGNVPAGLINTMIGPQGDAVEVRNLTPTFGGQQSAVRIVTADDRERLIGVLRQQIQERAFRELAPRLTGDQFLVPETVQIVEERSDWLSFDYAVGQAADNLSLTMRAVVSIVAVDESLAEQVAYARLSQQVERGRIIDAASLRYERGTVLGVEANGRITFTMAGEASVRARIDAAALSTRLAGMPVADAEAYLASELDLATDSTPEIVLSPGGLPILPLLPLRIQIVEAAP